MNYDGSLGEKQRQTGRSKGETVRLLALMVLILCLTGCASNILVSNCRTVEVEGDDTERWVCDKGWSDYWR